MTEKEMHHVEDFLAETVFDTAVDEKSAVARLPTEQQFDPKAEKRLLRKIDLRLIPIVVLLHTVSLIDRTNISAARVSGLDQDLNLTVGYRASIVTSTFFIGYIAFDIPSNILLPKIGAARFLGTITFLWGVITIALGCVNGWQGFAVLRVLLGIFEAGNTPGSIFLVSAWYRRFEVQTRLGYYYLFSMGISAFSSLLAAGIVQIAHHTTWKGWRWLFVIEGSVTSLLGLIAYFFLVDFPNSPKNKFLTEEEKQMVTARLAAERGTHEGHRVTWRSTGKDLRDWKVWACTYMYMSATIGSYAFSFFLPLILKKSMGFSQTLSLVLSTPPAIFAVIVSMIISKLSDKFRMRGPFYVLQCVMSVVGLAMTGYLKAAAPRYVGVFLGYAGVNGMIPAALAWQANNCREGRKRAVAGGLQIMFGASGGLAATYIYRQQDAPGYVPGMTTVMAVVALAMFVAVGTSLGVRKLNKDADEGKRILEGIEGFRYAW